MTAKATHRNDTELFADARRALDRHPTIPATVRVHVENGVATLTGIVRHVTERTEAMTLVRQVHGIEHVVNKITVAQVPSEDSVEP